MTLTGVDEGTHVLVVKDLHSGIADASVSFVSLHPLEEEWDEWAISCTHVNWVSLYRCVFIPIVIYFVLTFSPACLRKQIVLVQ